MLKVCFDLSAAVQQGAGISRYEAQLAKALVELNGPAPYSFFYTSPQRFEQFPLDPVLNQLPHRGEVVGNKQWRLRFLVNFLLRRNYDHKIFGGKPPANTIYHGMDILVPHLSVPTVATVYDISFLLYPQLHSRYNRLYLRTILPLCVRSAKRIIAISENTRRDLINWLGSSVAERIRVVPGGVSNESSFEDLAPDQLDNVLARYGLLNRPYILGVGTIEPRKNYSGLVSAYAGLVKNGYENTPLVIVGRVGWQNEYERVKEIAQNASLSVQESVSAQNPARQVVILTGVNDSDLRALYQGAAVFSYPSLYEGFGLPVLEAMAAGAPVITSNVSSLPEVTGTSGEAAILINPTDTTAHTQALQNLLANPDLTQQLRSAARQRARIFTWRRSAELTSAVYEEAFTAH